MQSSADAPSARHEVLEELFDAHADYVYASLRRLGVPPRDLEDLTQDVFITAHGALPRYDSQRPAKPWLFAICYRVAANYRRLARHRAELGRGTELAACSPSPEELVNAREERSLLDAALDVLSSEHRAVFVLHVIDGVSGPDIAAAFGIPLNTVYSRVRLARQSVEASLRALSAQGGRS